MRFPYLRVALPDHPKAGDRQLETGDGSEGADGYQPQLVAEFLWPLRPVGQQRRKLEKVVCDLGRMLSKPA